MDIFVFILCIITLIINVIISNENMKNREKLDAFIKATAVYATAYDAMAANYNKAAASFTAMKEVTDNQADLLESILKGNIPVLEPLLQRPQGTKAGRKSAKVRSGTTTKSTKQG